MCLKGPKHRFSLTFRKNLMLLSKFKGVVSLLTNLQIEYPQDIVIQLKNEKDVRYTIQHPLTAHVVVLLLLLL